MPNKPLDDWRRVRYMVRMVRKLVQYPRKPKQEELADIEGESEEVEGEPEEAPVPSDHAVTPKTLEACDSALDACRARIQSLEKLRLRLEIAQDPEAYVLRRLTEERETIRAEFEEQLAQLKANGKRAKIASKPDSTGRLSDDTVVAAVAKVQPASRAQIAEALGIPNKPSLGLMLARLRDEKRIRMIGEKAASRYSIK